jgi:hypothetical protein
MPSQEYTYLNATLVKEVARLGGRVRGLVPPVVEERLRRRLRAAALGAVAASPRRVAVKRTRRGA